MQLLLTFALVFIVGDAAKLIWGREEHSVAMPAILAGRAQAFGLVFPLYRLFLIAAGAAVAAGLWLSYIERAGASSSVQRPWTGICSRRSASIHASSSRGLRARRGARRPWRRARRAGGRGRAGATRAGDH